MASVELINVTKIYDKKVKAVDNASLTIEDREFVVLVGPSGCGKSTLLRMIAGLEEVTEGEIYIDDKLVNHVQPKARDIAMVFQNYALYPHMTVYGNLAFGLKLRKIPKKLIQERVSEAAQILQIEDFLDRKPKALSGGQRQRVALGRAIVRKPKVFLFDEPLSNLDAKLRVQMRIEINRLYQSLQTTMIYVTHDQVEAMTMGSKIVVLKDGIIQQVASPLSLYNNPANKFVAGFIGSPSMNFFKGQVLLEPTMSFHSRLMRFTIPDGVTKSLEGYREKEVILGVRPEAIKDMLAVNNIPLSEPQKVTVDVVEPIGNEIFLYFRDDDKSYCMRMPSDRLYSVGDLVEIRLELDKLYFFDPTDDSRIA